jgi:hypothetical protein
VPAVAILGVAPAVFGALYTIDRMVGGARSFSYFDYTHDHITDAVGSLSGLFAAVLGIIITVVSIIVSAALRRGPVAAPPPKEARS